MKFSISLPALTACMLQGAFAYSFYPENNESFTNSKLPWQYNISETATLTGVTSSYWTCSFLTASDNHQYVLLGHTMWIGGAATARASILDLDDMDYYEMFLYDLANETVTAPNDRFDASVGDVGIRSLTDDNVSLLHSYSNHGNVRYDLTVSASSQALYNGGLGVFEFSGDACGEWGIPAGRTEGTFYARGKELQIIPEKSFTWYDRQWGNGTAPVQNYTWFQLHVPGTDIKASMWAIDYSDSQIRIATFRFADGTHQVYPFEFTQSSQATYYSEANNRTYATAWTLEFPGRGHIDVKSVRPDQVTYNTSSVAPAAYEGFSVFNVSLFGIDAEGYGLTEVVFSI